MLLLHTDRVPEPYRKEFSHVHWSHKPKIDSTGGASLLIKCCFENSWGLLSAKSIGPLPISFFQTGFRIDINVGLWLASWVLLAIFHALQWHISQVFLSVRLDSSYIIFSWRHFPTYMASSIMKLPLTPRREITIISKTNESSWFWMKILTMLFQLES